MFGHLVELANSDDDLHVDSTSKPRSFGFGSRGDEIFNLQTEESSDDGEGNGSKMAASM